MADIFISDSIKYIGVDDKTLDLFESQYVLPEGVSYNSYLILDDKIAVMDTADARMTTEWLANLKEALLGRTPNYLVITHIEPDHAGSIGELIKAYPQIKLVGNKKTFAMFNQFFDIELGERAVEVGEGSELNLGTHTLKFFLAPMVHWPEVMVAYESTDKVLFSADAFGKFGTLDSEDDEGWACEARRYYFNIVGKYGAQVQALLKKTAALDIRTICPLHGPVLNEDLEYYIDKYNTWSSYTPEDDGVTIAYASIHGNTAKAAKRLAEILEEKGAKKVSLFDLSRDDEAEAVEDAFRYDKMVLMSSSYDAGVFPPMERFLHHLKAKNYQNRRIALIENGSWAPSAAKTMRAIVETFKNVAICETVITIKSTMSEANERDMYILADEILG